MNHMGPAGWLERAKKAEQEVVRLRAQLQQAAIAAMAVQAEQTEPVAWMYEHPDDMTDYGTMRLTDADKAAGWTETPLYAHPPAQWQGIESAPRDWTDVLVFSPKHSGSSCGGVFSAFYDTAHPGWFAHGPGDNIPLTPTHWMPLPTPPAGGSDE